MSGEATLDDPSLCYQDPGRLTRHPSLQLLRIGVQSRMLPCVFEMPMTVSQQRMI